MPSSPYPKLGDPEFDPYELLGIEQGASDGDINKAYRKLALRLHPDKQSDIDDHEAEKIAWRFHAVQDARAFLLEAEHAEARRKYDAKRASQLLRKKQDTQREMHMSERRKRMRDELRQKEEASKKRQRPSASSKAQRQRPDDDGELLEKLRRQGKTMKEQFADRQAQVEDEERREAAARRKRAKRDLEDRQVRLKWSRKKTAISHSEHSLAQLLSRFGDIDQVEMIGSKGNAALITFADASSCRPCVEYYAASDEMRTTFVGLRKENEEEREAASAREDYTAPTGYTSRNTDKEDLEDRKIRQAAEREELLRQMEMEEAGHKPVDTTTSVKFAAGPTRVHRSTRPYPLDFPDTDEYRDLSPLQKLERFEKEVFREIQPETAVRQ